MELVVIIFLSIYYVSSLGQNMTNGVDMGSIGVICFVAYLGTNALLQDDDDSIIRR